ncbi:zinc-binding dehydrogenase [Demequina lignilytica]|uniref:Alcohol dehydrogenase catalytic domain-containing protein n=1 Tax=Demequina lignilytica TaxID=3051663 RepID=A0AB35MEW2_9MICO|nr:alcohol dehydrogenase catalytic domain-containing protein [Demequina sp. SYSU T0a273]MDN4482302.1 alcohol dehydrogenase catalytic domain-containing protein [Demequina sp. SYSU T0a273]
MKATYMFGAGDVRVLDVPDPRIVDPTDAVVRVVRGCICGSDLHPFHTMEPTEQGSLKGHEAIGVIEEVGPEVRTVAPGDFVIMPFATQDNTCVHCRDGVHTSCVNGGFLAGGQSEALRLPQADGSAVTVPGVDPAAADDALLASLLTLSDVYLTGWHAAAMARVAPGATVTVIGDGAVGLCAVLSAREMGAERIILMGRHQVRTDLGREWGATDVVSARGEDGIAEVLDLTDGAGSPVVLEAVGLEPAYRQAHGIVRPGGVISRVGVPQYATDPVSSRSQFSRNVTLTGGVAPVRAYVDAAIPKVLDGAIDPGRVFDMTVGVADVPAGYAAMDERRALKVMVDPSL